MGANVCCTEKPAERDVGSVWPTQDPVWVATQSSPAPQIFALCTSVWQISPSVLAPAVPKDKCTKEEFNQFSYRLLDWFLLLSRMGKSYSPGAPSQRCLSHKQRTRLAQVSHVCVSRLGGEAAGVSGAPVLARLSPPREHQSPTSCCSSS